MPNCDKLINEAINAGCSTPALITGLEDIAVIINRDDIDFSGIDLSSIPHAPLASIPLKAGRTGFMVKQINDSFKGTKSELEKKRFRSNRKNTFAFVVFDDLGVAPGVNTSISTLTLGVGGIGYAVGDILKVVESGVTNYATIKVTAVSGGVITTWTYLSAGLGYTAGAKTTLALTGAGSGCTFTAATLKTSPTPYSTDALINQLDNGRFVVVYQKRTKNIAGDIEYKVMGLYRGLEAVKSTTDYYDEETNGATPYELVEEGAPEGPIAFYTTSKAATDSAFQSLAAIY